MENARLSWSAIQQAGRKYGPYLLLEAVMPGGTLLALTLYLYRRAGQRYPLKAALSFARSSFFIFSIAANVRSRAATSSLAYHVVICAGTTCHETPKRSFTQPHSTFAPPLLSASQ